MIRQKLKYLLPSVRREHERDMREELEALREFMQPECEIYLYCSCAHEATSVRVASELLPLGLKVAVIEDGLRGWRAAGLELEQVPPEELAALPLFT